MGSWKTTATVGGYFLGGPAGALAANQAAQDGNSSSTPPPPPSVDYSAAMGAMSNNDKTVALAQIMGQDFAMQQASLDRELQAAANLELGLANLDTKLQTGKMDFMAAMTAEADHHAEKLAGIAAEHQALQNGGATQTAGSDIPAPNFFA